VRAVKSIQDVATRWWSTWSICDQLIRLKAYLALLKKMGVLTSNLSEAQRQIVGDLEKELKPFMIAQKLLDGQS
jgi:predicted  nucleic acid-binding Zn ribbon protein